MGVWRIDENGDEITETGGDQGKEHGRRRDPYGPEIGGYDPAYNGEDLERRRGEIQDDVTTQIVPVSDIIREEEERRRRERDTTVVIPDMDAFWREQERSRREKKPPEGRA